MASSVKISIILPNYNSEKHITRAIDSFLMQEYDNKEMIIVDAKSTDGSHAIIKNYIEKHDNIIWIQEKDRNVTDGINIGLKYCTGDYIAFLAADVYYYSADIFSTINKSHQLVPFDGIYFDGYIHFSKRGTMMLKKCPLIDFNKNNLLSYGTMVLFDNIFLSKKVYTENRYNPDYNLCSDWEFFLRITQQFTLFMYTEKAATICVMDGDNLSMKYAAEQQRQIREVFSLYNTDNVAPYFGVEVVRKPEKRIKRVLRKIWTKL